MSTSSKLFRLVLLIGLLASSVGTYLADYDALTVSLTNIDCGSTVVNYDYPGGNFAMITIYDETANRPLGTEGPYPTSGPITVSGPPLPDGTWLVFTVEIYGSQYVANGLTFASLDFAQQADMPDAVLLARGTARIQLSCSPDVQLDAPSPNMCDDGRLNVNLCEPLAIYAVPSNGGLNMVVYDVQCGDGVGDYSYMIPHEILSNLPDVQTPCTLALCNHGFSAAYLLPNGEIQLNAGPDFEGKMFVYLFHEFPGVPEISTYMTDQPLLVLPMCDLNN